MAGGLVETRDEGNIDRARKHSPQKRDLVCISTEERGKRGLAERTYISRGEFIPSPPSIDVLERFDLVEI